MTKVIALENPPPGRVYGEEFDQPEGSELTSWLLEKRVRVDDRMGTPGSMIVARAIAEDAELRRAEANLTDGEDEE